MKNRLELPMLLTVVIISLNEDQHDEIKQKEESTGSTSSIGEKVVFDNQIRDHCEFLYPTGC